MTMATIAAVPLMALAFVGAWQARAKPLLWVGCGVALGLGALLCWREVPVALWPGLSAMLGVWAGACAIDLATRRLPDVLTLGGFVALVFALGGSMAAGVSPGAVIAAVLSGIVSGAVFLAIGLIAPHQFGLGDVKLALTTGTVLGLFGWYAVLLGHAAAFVTSALAGLAVAAFLKRIKGVEVPFGPFMAVGAVVGPAIMSGLT
ncbi:MAG: prepilin peptidase [Propionibacteriaceae bacterium]|nr:prepilin peptidase [Propionibacteriaceae bacterium]